jgi:hypothetical protein
MSDTRRGQFADECTKDICNRIDAVKAKIDFGDLSEAELQAAQLTMRDLNKHLDKRIEELQNEMATRAKPKKLLGFI